MQPIRLLRQGIQTCRLCSAVRPPAILPCFSRPASHTSKQKASAAPPEYVEPKSALFVSGSAGQYVTFVVDPHLDFDAIFEQWTTYQAELQARQHPTPPADLATAWKTLQSLRKQQADIDAARGKLSSAIAAGEDLSEAARLDGRRLRDEAKVLTKAINSLENQTVLELLKLPTRLHADTPRSDKPVVIAEGEKKITRKSPPPSDRFVSFFETSPRGYFLRGKLAELELRLIFYTKAFLTDRGFAPVSGPHLYKSAVLEGAGAVLSSNQPPSFMVETEDSYESPFRSVFLAHSPLINFAAYFTNCEVSENILPLQLVSSGRIYRPHSVAADTGLKDRLFYPDQTHCVSLCSASLGFDQTEKAHEKLLDLIIEFYRHLRIPYRVVLLPAPQLQPSESLRYQAEVWSPSRSEYIPCGYIAVNDEYVSRRLRCHVGQPEDLKFLSLVHGSVVDLTPFLACCLENLTDDPDEWFKEIVPSL